MLAQQKTTQKSANDSLLYPSAQVYDWGTTLVVSAHPNHEVLGCGGAMALLRQMGYRVHVLFIGDGSGGNVMEPVLEEPTEKKDNTQEVYDLMGKVGISDDATIFLNLTENLIPQRDQPGFEEAVRLCLNEMELFQPDTILIPFLDQGDRDVQATWQIVRAAARQSHYPLRVVEYRLWSWNSPIVTDLSSETRYKSWRLDIKEVVDLKISALDGQQHHRLNFPFSNHDHEMLIHLSNPWEVYLEYNSEDLN